MGISILQHLPKAWSGPLWDGPYRPQKWSGPRPKNRVEIDAYVNNAAFDVIRCGFLGAKMLKNAFPAGARGAYSAPQAP